MAGRADAVDGEAPRSAWRTMRARNDHVSAAGFRTIERAVGIVQKHLRFAQVTVSESDDSNADGCDALRTAAMLYSQTEHGLSNSLGNGRCSGFIGIWQE